jgi:NitT/TauT family transport system permease protein
MKNNLLKIGFFLGLFLLWQIVVWAKVLPAETLPGPAQVLASLGTLISNGSLLEGILVSLARLLVAYVAALIGGVAVGIVISRYEWMESTIGSLALALQTLPSICWLPLAVIWFGASEKAIFFVVVVGAILSVVLATESGIRHVPKVLIQAARSMGASGFPLYRKVILPAAFPAIITGFKQGWAFAWRTLMAAELLYGNKGLGFLLQAGKKNNDTSLFLAVILVLILIGVAVEMTFFRPLEKNVRSRWGLS